MIAREWKARLPEHQKAGFTTYLHQTGIKDAASTKGYKGAQVFTREVDGLVEITLITFWDSLESIKGFAGPDIDCAMLYPEDYRFGLDPDEIVSHYEVAENSWA